MKQYIYNFNDKKVKSLKNKKEILGGKGANLSEMGRLGLPVPPGFTITTDVCNLFYDSNKKLSTKITKNVFKELKSSFSANKVSAESKKYRIKWIIETQ